jgi:hypothetical protein
MTVTIRRSRLRRRLPLVAVCLLATTLTACGPKLSLQVGVREEFGDLTYGDKGKRVPPARPPAAAPEGFPAFVVPPVRPRPASVVPTTTTALPPLPVPEHKPKLCPGPGTFASPVDSAESDVRGLPAAGPYKFRRTGVLRVGQEQARNLAGPTVRTVANVQQLPVRVGETDGRRRFDVAEEDQGLKTTTTYEVAPQSALPGLSIVAITTEGGPAGTTSFVPQPSVRIFNLPAKPEPSATDDQGVDPLSGTIMRVSHQTTGRTRVDGCHDRYDAWEVAITGKLVGAAQVLDLSATLSVATQFGGLILRDDVSLTGLDHQATYELHSQNVIDLARPVP